MFLFLYNFIDLYKRTVLYENRTVNENQYFNLPMQIGGKRFIFMV